MKSGLDQRFAAYRGRRATELRNIPLFLHLIPFTRLIPFIPVLYRIPSLSSRAKLLGCAISSIIQSERTGYGLVRQLTGMYVESLTQSTVLGDRRPPTVIRQGLYVRQVALVSAKVEVLGTAPGMLVTQ